MLRSPLVSNRRYLLLVLAVSTLSSSTLILARSAGEKPPPVHRGFLSFDQLPAAESRTEDRVAGYEAIFAEMDSATAYDPPWRQRLPAS